MRGLTARELERRRVIRAQLCELSKDGWRHAKPCDYEPLERELRQLDDREMETVRRRLDANLAAATRVRR